MEWLPSPMTFLQRGWLSSNHLLLTGCDETVLIDSGYVSHAHQTRALIEHALQGRPLDRLINTHLHSDHCGGNAMLQAHYPQLQTCIAPGLADAVADWDETRLTYLPTGQDCPRFSFQHILCPGDERVWAGLTWQIHPAPGHDPHAVILFEPIHGVLVSADALWEHGFGVVFPEIEGEDGFSGIAQTLELITSLQPRWVVPGHGNVFQDVDAALARARARLQSFVSAPTKHANHAAKVLLKFKLLDWQRIDRDRLMHWACCCRFLVLLHQRYLCAMDLSDWIEQLMHDLVKAQAARQDQHDWVNI